MANVSEICCNPNNSTFPRFDNHCEGSCIFSSLLVIHKILRLFVNTLTANDKVYLLNGENLAERINIQLSQQQKALSQFFFAFLKSIINFKRLPKKDDPHS